MKKKIIKNMKFDIDDESHSFKAIRQAWREVNDFDGFRVEVTVEGNDVFRINYAHLDYETPKEAIAEAKRRYETEPWPPCF